MRVLLLIFLFQGVLSAGQMDSRSPGLVGLWHMNEATGSSIKDSTQNQNAGAITGASWVSGRWRTCLYFDGNDEVNFGDKASMKPTAALSMMAWVYVYAFTAYDGIFEQAAGVGYFLRYSNASNKKIMHQLYIAGGWKQQTGNTVLSIGKWYHIATSWNGSIMRLYLNGQPDAAPVTATGSLSYTAGDTVRLGHAPQGETYCNALIEEAALYGRGLSVGEITRIYQEGLGRRIHAD